MTFIEDIPDLRKSDKFFHVWENVLDIRPKFSDFENFFISKGMKFIDKNGQSKVAFKWDSSRGPIKHGDLHFFPGIAKIIAGAEKIYGIDNQISYITTQEDANNLIHAQMHNDKGDVLHFACEGDVKWRLIPPGIKIQDAKIEDIFTITLKAGDVLWFRGWTSHETTPLTARAGIIWLNNLDELHMNPYYTPDKVVKIEGYQGNIGL
jgi:hypothetical protein